MAFMEMGRLNRKGEGKGGGGGGGVRGDQVGTWNVCLYSM